MFKANDFDKNRNFKFFPHEKRPAPSCSTYKAAWNCAWLGALKSNSQLLDRPTLTSRCWWSQDLVVDNGPRPCYLSKVVEKARGLLPLLRCVEDVQNQVARAWKETFTVKSFIKRKASYSTTSRRGVLIVDNGSKYNRKQENNNIRTVGIRRFAFKPLLSLVHSSPVRNRKFHFKPYSRLVLLHCLVHFHLIWSCIKDVPDIG